MGSDLLKFFLKKFNVFNICCHWYNKMGQTALFMHTSHFIVLRATVKQQSNALPNQCIYVVLHDKHLFWSKKKG